MEPMPPPDPAQPMLDLPGRLAVDLLDTAHQVAPAAFGVLVAVLLVLLAVRVIRELV